MPAIKEQQASTKDRNSQTRARKLYRRICAYFQSMMNSAATSQGQPKNAESRVSRQCVQDWVIDRESLQETKRQHQIAVRKRGNVPSINDLR